LRRTGRRDKSQVKVKNRIKAKAKVKVEENFENFEDNILENKVETQVKVELEQYQACAILNPSFNSIRGFQPKDLSIEISNNFIGVPSGFVLGAWG